MNSDVITSNETLSSMMTVALRNFNLIQDFSIELTEFEECDNGVRSLGCNLRNIFNYDVNCNRDELFYIESTVINDKTVKILHLNEKYIDKLSCSEVVTYTEEYDNNNNCSVIMIFINNKETHQTVCQINIHHTVYENDEHDEETKILLEYFSTDKTSIYGCQILSNLLHANFQRNLNGLTIKSMYDEYSD